MTRVTEEVCDFCGGNCGQCGTSVGMGIPPSMDRMIEKLHEPEDNMHPGLVDHVRRSTLQATPRPRRGLWLLRFAWWTLGFVSAMLFWGFP